MVLGTWSASRSGCKSLALVGATNNKHNRNASFSIQFISWSKSVDQMYIGSARSALEGKYLVWMWKIARKALSRADMEYVWAFELTCCQIAELADRVRRCKNVTIKRSKYLTTIHRSFSHSDFAEPIASPKLLIAPRLLTKPTQSPRRVSNCCYLCNLAHFRVPWIYRYRFSFTHTHTHFILT